MTADELRTWEAYVEENGPLNFPLRIESAIARSAAPFMGKSVRPRDLMIWPREPEPEATPEAIFLALKKAASASKRKH